MKEMTSTVTSLWQQSPSLNTSIRCPRRTESTRWFDCGGR